MKTPVNSERIDIPGDWAVREAMKMILAECGKAIARGYTPDHDATHGDGSLALAAEYLLIDYRKPPATRHARYIQRCAQLAGCVPECSRWPADYASGLFTAHRTICPEEILSKAAQFVLAELARQIRDRSYAHRIDAEVEDV